MSLEFESVEQLEDELKLREEAATAASQGTIRSGDSTYDAPQFKIIKFMENKVAKAGQDTITFLQDFKRKRSEIAGELIGFPRQSFSKMVQARALETLKGYEQRLLDIHSESIGALTALKAYRVRNAIVRSAHYPKWGVMHWAIVVSLCFGESVLNTQFFAKASPFGLIGGWLQALIISIINVLMGLLGGMVVLPWRHQREAIKESTLIPTLVAAAVCFFVIIFNMATAHYRVLLEDDPDQAIKLAISHLTEAPFDISNFDAWVLLFVGLLFCTIAWIEGYKSDDPLRDYGRLDRASVAAREKRATLRDQVRDEVVKRFRETMSEVESLARKGRMLLADHRAQIARSKGRLAEYSDFRSRVTAASNNLLKRYRQHYQEIAQVTPEPAYFNRDFTLAQEPPFLEELENISSDEGQTEELMTVVNNLEANRNKANDEEVKVLRELQKEIDDFFEKVEIAGMKQSLSLDPNK